MGRLLVQTELGPGVLSACSSNQRTSDSRQNILQAGSGTASFRIASGRSNSALTAIASAMHQKNYTAQGRTLAQLGIDHYTVGELKTILKKGFPPNADVDSVSQPPAKAGTADV